MTAEVFKILDIKSADERQSRQSRARWYSSAMRRGPIVAVLLAACILPAHAILKGQTRPLPVLDMHLHAMAADDQGPPPVGMCLGLVGIPAWDQRGVWAEQFLAWMKAAVWGCGLVACDR